MENSHIGRLFAKYVTLNIIGMIGLSCYILADTFFVARGLGANGLTALNLAIPVFSFIHGCGLMLGMGGATRFTLSKTKTIYAQALWFAAALAVVFISIGIFGAEALAALLGADSAVLADTAVYLKTILCLSPLFLCNNIVLCFVRNDNSPHLSMLAMLLGSLANVALDYVFIFPCGMGMFGAALATVMAPAISLMILSVHFIKKQNTFHVAKVGIKFRSWLDISALGFSALITEFSSGIVIIVLNFLILDLAGNLGVAAYGIITNIALVVISAFTGIAEGMQPIVSRAYRLESRSDLKKLLRYGFCTALAIAVVIYVCSCLWTEPMVAAFNKDGDLELAAMAVGGIRIYFSCFIFVAVNILSAAYFSAVDNPKYGMIISILRGFAVIIPVAVLMAFCFGLTGVWLAMPLAELLVMLVTVILLHRSNKQLTKLFAE